jgi:L-threonylcarbamoyladenylate synthase
MGQVLRIDPLNPDRTALERIAEIVRQGGVIVYPTDTIYGLGCAPDQEGALRRILTIKRRDQEKGLLLLVAGRKAANLLCAAIPAAFDRLAGEFWPGPVTFLLPARGRLSRLITGDRGLVGLRQPDSVYLQLLMEMIPGPLVSTSANVAGEQPSGRVGELSERLADQVDLFVDGGDVRAVVASTVADLSVTPPRVVRAGAIAKRVEEAIARL